MRWLRNAAFVAAILAAVIGGVSNLGAAFIQPIVERFLREPAAPLIHIVGKEGGVQGEAALQSDGVDLEPGEPFVVVNDDDVPHTVVVDDTAMPPQVIPPGGQAPFSFGTPDNYTLRCLDCGGDATTTVTVTDPDSPDTNAVDPGAGAPVPVAGEPSPDAGDPAAGGGTPQPGGGDMPGGGSIPDDPNDPGEPPPAPTAEPSWRRWLGIVVTPHVEPTAIPPAPDATPDPVVAATPVNATVLPTASRPAPPPTNTPPPPAPPASPHPPAPPDPPDPPPAPPEPGVVPAVPPRPASPTPTPNVCPGVERHIPADVLEAALAAPHTVDGWIELQNPNVPEGPNNPRRVRLSLHRPDRPYDALWNGMTFKAGCP